jgi:hypothetical protein
MEKITVEEIETFKEDWGQSHEEICSCLEYDEKGSDEQIMADGYFWMATSNIWCNKSASMFTEREQEIADFLILNCSL